MHTRIVLIATAALILLGSLAIYTAENNYALKGMPLKEKLSSCIFTAITPRTAGFNILPTESLQAATKFFIIFFMFIGASPGSTGGGIKTVTFIVLLAGFISMLKGRDRIFLFKRTIERDAFRKAIAIFVLSVSLVLFSTVILATTEKSWINTDNGFLSLFFESASAFATCGLSTGVTPHLTPIGKLVIILTMFFGRVGPLTATLALALRIEEKADYRYPEEKIMVG